MAIEMTGEIRLEGRLSFVTENVHVKCRGDRTTLNQHPGAPVVQGINALSIHQLYCRSPYRVFRRIAVR